MRIWRLMALGAGRSTERPAESGQAPNVPGVAAKSTVSVILGKADSARTSSFRPSLTQRPNADVHPTRVASSSLLPASEVVLRASQAEPRTRRRA